jgi:hypothetical protein
VKHALLLIARFPEQFRAKNPPNDMVMLMDIAPAIMDYCTGRIPDEMELHCRGGIEKLKFL